MIFLLILPMVAFANQTMRMPKEVNLDVPIFETKVNIFDTETITTKNEKIKCRTVCDKKISKEQKIEEAILFYKNSKDYTFAH